MKKVALKSRNNSGDFCLSLLLLLILWMASVEEVSLFAKQIEHPISDHLQFTIVHQNSKIGWIKLQKSKSENRQIISLQSEISTRFIVKYIIIGIEESTFENGVLVNGAIWRVWNGQEKANKTIQKTPQGYQMHEKGQTEVIKLPSVTFNLHCLYFEEPKGLTEVFSDNYGRFFPISEIDNGLYAIVFPNQVQQRYLYKEGKLQEVTVKGPAYKLRFLLEP
ncbi:DUF6134 family protein [Pararhodonellum marinum]|uniref:DUF6134 family protein n=1 Tax=Pararhodonellum marinum TaxID=2755358 RepID=UPI00188E718C|nr:DUF6134 family protein [Pararhodonellum marinum]